jgi:hypothetical protein
VTREFHCVSSRSMQIVINRLTSNTSENYYYVICSSEMVDSVCSRCVPMRLKLTSIFELAIMMSVHAKHTSFPWVGGYPHVIRSQVLVYTCEFRHVVLSRLSHKGCQMTRMCVSLVVELTV